MRLFAKRLAFRPGMQVGEHRGSSAKRPPGDSRNFEVSGNHGGMLSAVKAEPVKDPAAIVDAFLDAGGRVVTFDVFDTLLWRRVLFPVDVFELLPSRLSIWLRPCAEFVATTICRHIFGREPRLEDIYRIFPFEVESELEVEGRLVVANPYCLATVRRLLANRVLVAAVSDMYLSAEQIGRLLRTAGYPTLTVFSSSDEQASKHDGGRLFLRVGERLRISSPGWMHVGDSAHADIAMAGRHGIATCRVITPRETLLELLPELSSLRARRRYPVDAGLLGELAIRLHLSAQDSQPSEFSKRLRTALSEGPAAVASLVHVDVDQQVSAREVRR